MWKCLHTRVESYIMLLPNPIQSGHLYTYRSTLGALKGVVKGDLPQGNGQNKGALKGGLPQCNGQNKGALKGGLPQGNGQN